MVFITTRTLSQTLWPVRDSILRHCSSTAVTANDDAFLGSVHFCWFYKNKANWGNIIKVSKFLGYAYDCKKYLTLHSLKLGLGSDIHLRSIAQKPGDDINQLAESLSQQKCPSRSDRSAGCFLQHLFNKWQLQDLTGWRTLNTNQATHIYWQPNKKQC